MAEIIILASVSLIFLLILIQNFSFRFLYDGFFSLELDYSLLSVSLLFNDGGKKPSKIPFSQITAIKRALELYLSRAKLRITKIFIGTEESEPDKFGVRYSNTFSVFSAALVYLSKKTKSLSVDDDSVIIESNPEVPKKYYFDVSLTAPLYATLAPAIKILIILVKQQKKQKSKIREGKNV